ncbi:hypothetical protein L0F63_006195 [Massospora cicadina]|nr:hypothetical protein L0F63_006195 [Massospora cicadina]
MDFMDSIDPRYPSCTQTKLLSKVIRSSQYEPHSTTYRSSVYPQLNGELGKSISRRSRYQVAASDRLESPLKARDSIRHSKPQAPSNSFAAPRFFSQTRTSCLERHPQAVRRSKYQAGTTPKINIPASPAIPTQPSSERHPTQSKCSPCLPDAKHLMDPMRLHSPPNASTRPQPDSDAPVSSTEDSPDDLDSPPVMDNGKDEDVIAPPSPSKPLTEVGEYIVKKDIGHGTFGVVKLGEHKITHQKAAIKVITKASIKSARARARVEQELRLLPLLEHPHIVKVYDVVEDEERFMIVMEHLDGGELFQYIIKHRRVNEREGRYFFRQIISALDYCHQNAIIHRDLKPENLLFDAQMQIRLIDFGFANFYHADRTLSTFCGSPYYASPEMIRGLEYVGPEVDVWSLGVTLYTMLSGKLPFNAHNLKGFQRKVTRGEYEVPVYFSREVAELIRGMLHTDRRRRLTLEQIRLHAWTNAGYSDLPNSYLTIRPPTVRTPDPEILRRMKVYGFEEEASRTTLITNNRPVQPIFNLYHLLETQRQRKAREQLRVCHQGRPDRPLEAPSAPSIPQGSPAGSEGEEPVAVPSRSYSVDTVRDEDFEGDIPLSQTTLKSAGRSFDSISRRCSVPSKLRPVGMPSALGTRDAPTSPRCEVGAGLLLGKEPKDGWFIGLFNVSVTSTKPHQQIVQELERVLGNLQILYQATESRFVCHSPPHKLAFEVRITWKAAVKAFAVQFNNLAGSSWAHKKYCYKIIQRMFI